MSFRNRLTVFFIVLVILPMIVVAAVGFVLASDSEQGKTDARLSEAQRSASGLFREYQDRAEAAARVIARDPAARRGDPGGDGATRSRRASTSWRGTHDVVRGVMTLEGAGASRPGAATSSRPPARA